MISLYVKIPKFPISLFRTNPRKKSNFFHEHNMSWSCKKCTFINSPSTKSSCNICFSSPPSSPNLASSSSPSNSAAQWSCKACTFLNLYPTPNCQVCDTRRPVLTSASIKELISVDDDEVDSSVGSVFMPLRACKKLKMDTFGEKSDGFSKSMAIDEAKIVSLDEDSEKEAVMTLKIMSYNVWFREDLEVHARMRAIGDLIQLHSPDIICFQEVTPDIYELFRSHPWWKGYRCSVSATEAQLRGYFCLQLSKLDGTKFSCKPFGFSAMGRELCVAEAETPTGKSIIVATSHLESPCPAPPKWDQMFSKERVQQANEAINFLKNYPNAIFCGDMNWDDKLDGSFPVHKNWVDAWTELRPNEHGWTYDTKANKMLSGNRTLQKRLDRFLCCFRDFKISDISMIGMEALPELSYVKEKKVKSETKRIVLPVLPSDHFGLLLTVTSR